MFLKIRILLLFILLINIFPVFSYPDQETGVAIGKAPSAIVKIREENELVYAPFTSSQEHLLKDPYDPEDEGDPIGVLPVQDNWSVFIIAFIGYAIYKKRQYKKKLDLHTK